MTLHTIRMTALAGLVAALPSAVFAQDITLRISHYVPPTMGVHVLALTAPNPAMLNTRAPVRVPDDLEGLRIRTPTPGVSAMLTALGATPVGLPPSEMYENLQRGTLDGAAIGWNAVASFRLYEVTNDHTIGSFYVVPFFFVMNQGTYDGLPGRRADRIL